MYASTKFARKLLVASRNRLVLLQQRQDAISHRLNELRAMASLANDRRRAERSAEAVKWAAGVLGLAVLATGSITWADASGIEIDPSSNMVYDAEPGKKHEGDESEYKVSGNRFPQNVEVMVDQAYSAFRVEFAAGEAEYHARGEETLPVRDYRGWYHGICSNRDHLQPRSRG